MKIVPDIVTGWKMKTFLEKERLSKTNSNTSND